MPSFSALSVSGNFLHEVFDTKAYDAFDTEHQDREHVAVLHWGL
jgi:hypothetical protein